MSEKRVRILEKIETPLAFFALVLLAAEAIVLSLGSDAFIGGMAFLIILTITVAVITFFRPGTLTLSGKHVLGSELAVKNTGSNGRKLEPALSFTNSDSTEFSRHFEKLFSNAKRIVLIGTGINILHRDPLFNNLMKRVERNNSFQLEIYAANPFSPSVETRLIEEETGYPKPKIAKRGLIQWLKMMLKEQERLQNPTNISIKLFSHYPTLALFIIEENDKDDRKKGRTNFLFYPYGYAQLGTFSPVVHYSDNNREHEAMIGFFKAQYKRIKDSAVDAALIFNARENKASPEQLSPFAVYFVPDEKTSLYKFGSEVLGYDVRTQTPVEATPWSDYVGAASDFGFHLTIADALYCVDPIHEIMLISKEIEFVVQELQPFNMSFTIEKDFPDEHSISLVCQDESGTLEALHFEMVWRCYKKAAASNYSLKLAEANRDSDKARAKLMIERYKAPYIIKRFNPHFTLLTNVPLEQKDEIFKNIKKLYEEKVTATQIEIDKIALMIKPEKNQLWSIKQEIRLGE